MSRANAPAAAPVPRHTKLIADFLENHQRMVAHHADQCDLCKRAAFELATPAVQPEPEIRETLRDCLASGLTQAYGCSRTWSAWNVGTMTASDFYPASECDELCDLAIAALAPAAHPPAAAANAALVAALKDCARHPRKKQRDNIVRAALAAAGINAPQLAGREGVAS